MSEITIALSDIKKLRDMTGAGMMDCKKALNESEGDFEKAIEYLRKKGQKLSVKRADRQAKEGVVMALVSSDAKKGAVLRLSCETDFVAKNQDFVDLTTKFTEIALESLPADRDALLNLPYENITVGEKVMEQIGVIGEKLEITEYYSLEAEQVVSYIHMGHKAGVIVGMNKTDKSFEEIGKNVAMQVAAMKPVALDKDGVDPSIVKSEIEIGKDQARQEGKPEAIIEKIAMGKLNKFFKENTLLNQQYVKDGSMSVSQYIKTGDKELEVTGFRHIKLG